MSLAPFAALESRVNNAVFARLANAEVSIEGGSAFGGIFDDGYALGSVGQLGMGASKPSVAVPSAQVPVEPAGKAITVNGVAYLVAAVEPDGVGSTRLLLEVA
jgi:hypothetical protein